MTASARVRGGLLVILAALLAMGCDPFPAGQCVSVEVERTGATWSMGSAHDPDLTVRPDDRGGPVEIVLCSGDTITVQGRTGPVVIRVR